MKPKKYASPTTSSDLMVKNTKKKKVRTTTTKKKSSNVDLISELPDSILHHILSYLDMTCVIQTGFLSKRWKFIWASLPFLNFDEKAYFLCSNLFHNDFLTFIDRVLLFRNHNSNIQSFHVHLFKFQDRNTLPHIHTWVHVLIRCNVQVFKIEIDSSNFVHLDPISLPISLFACKSLTTLKLDLGDHSYSPSPLKLLPAASNVYLPSLKTLHLISLCFLDLSGVEMLISTSPILETLLISRCTYNYSEPQILTISNDHLKSLVIIRMQKDLPEFYCRLKVFTPNLTSFTSKDYPVSHYSFETLPSLERAEMDSDFESYYLMDSDFHYDPDFLARRKKECIENVIKCIRGVSNARSLTMSAWVLELVAEALEKVEDLQIDPFCNLTFLSLNTSLSKYQICAITYLLAKCPNLRTLLLQMPKEHSISVEQEDEYWEAESAPHCVMHDLELVGIWDVVASTNELEFLKFLLNNAVVLEKMLIFISPDQRPTFERFQSFHDELMDLSLWSDKGVGFDFFLPE